jgi:hypothetical protein
MISTLSTVVILAALPMFLLPKKSFALAVKTGLIIPAAVLSNTWQLQPIIQ